MPIYKIHSSTSVSPMLKCYIEESH